LPTRILEIFEVVASNKAQSNTRGSDRQDQEYRWSISTRHASPARSPLFGPGPSSAHFSCRAGLGQETRHSELARHGPFTSKPVKPVFYTKTCLPARLARFSARFFRAKRTGLARLGPLRTGLGQEIESAGSAGPARFFGRASPGPGRIGRPFWPSLTRSTTTSPCKGWSTRICMDRVEAGLVLTIWIGLFGLARARFKNRSLKHSPTRNNMGRSSMS
jgi:hypothetical protein